MQVTRAPFLVGLVMALAFVVMADLAVRLFETRLSADIANTKAFPARVTSLSNAEGARVAAVGNSLIGDGLATDEFMAGWLAPNPGQGELVKFVPDGSSIWDWYCIANHQLAQAAQPPDLIMIGFGWNQLADQAPMNLSKTFNGICSASVLLEFGDIKGWVPIGDWLKMATVKTSKIYAHREAIRHRVLQHLVPHYRRMTRQANARAGAGGDTGAATAGASYRALRTVVSSASEQGTELVLVAMPVQQPYQIDRSLCGREGDHMFRLVDMRHTVPSSGALYRDNLHLNADGAKLFSQRLAKELRSPGALTSVCRL